MPKILMIGKQYFLYAVDLRRGICGALAILPRNQYMDITAYRLGRGHRNLCLNLYIVLIVFCND
jgi:hypothetical protein